MYVSSTTTAVPTASAANFTTLGIAANSRHGQWFSGKPDALRQTAHSPEQPQVSRLTRAAERMRAGVSRLKRRFVMGPRFAADDS